MRITGGKARGITLKVPPGDKVRPAMDATREAVFSHLGPGMQHARILDLFAGTGAYGLEALSRGAESCLFIEKDTQALAALESNLAAVMKALQQDLPALAIMADAFTWRPQNDATFDLVIADPPYALLKQRGGELLAHISRFLEPNAAARLILECPGEFAPDKDAPLRLVKRIAKGRHQPGVLVYASQQ